VTRAVIIDRQHPEEHTRTPEKACYWVAEAVIDGRVYTAGSRYGSSYELARVLVVAGIPDAPMEVRTVGWPGHMTYRSFHAAATYTIEENARWLRRVSYARVEAARERLRQRWVKAPKPGVNAPTGSTAPAAAPDVVAREPALQEAQ